MNLTKQPPRRPSNLSISGIVGLARMTDKARAYNNETLGEYLYGGESGLDRKILDFLSISDEQFAETVEEYLIILWVLGLLNNQPERFLKSKNLITGN